MINLFDNINDKNVHKLLDLFESHTITIKKNTTLQSIIVKPKKYIAYVLNGYLQGVKNDFNGNKIIIEEFEENDIFGNIISAHNNNDYEIIAKEDSKVIIIDYDNILSADTTNVYYNIFIKNLLSIITQKMNEVNQRVDILINKTIRNKLLEYFKIIYKENKSKIIYLPFTYTALADYLAIDRCAMSRELKNLKDEGMIEIKGRKIKLLYYI
jgi:CRP-like cAMP-binding protein